MGPYEVWAPGGFPRTKREMFSRELSKAWTSKLVKIVVKAEIIVFKADRARRGAIRIWTWARDRGEV